MSVPRFINQILTKVYEAATEALKVSVVSGNISGNFTPAGLGTADQVEIVLDDVTWVEATTGLTPRVNVLAQNISTTVVPILLWSYTGLGDEGQQITKGGSKSVQVLDGSTTTVWLKMKSGTGTGRVYIEELGPP